MAMPHADATDSMNTHKPADEMHRPHVNAALVVSFISATWTTASAVTAIAIGLSTDTSVLVAFGAVGIVDAIGSLALAYHFHHALRHDALSDNLERIAHRVVLFGLFTVGTASAIGGIVRLAGSQKSEASILGVTIAAASLIALLVLSTNKIHIAARIGSPALRSDGQLSLVGASQAAVTLGGAAATKWLEWRWADAAATTIIGGVAIGLAVTTWRTEHDKQ